MIAAFIENVWKETLRPQETLAFFEALYVNGEEKMVKVTQPFSGRQLHLGQ